MENKLTKVDDFCRLTTLKSVRGKTMSEPPVAVQHVPIQRLDADKFRPFGVVINEQDLTFPEFDPGEGRIALEKFRLKPSKLTREVLGFHFSYTQTVIVLGGKLALV